MKVRTPARRTIEVTSAGRFVHTPGDGVEVSDVAAAAPSGGPDHAVVTEATAGDFYVMVDAINYVVTQV